MPGSSSRARRRRSCSVRAPPSSRASSRATTCSSGTVVQAADGLLVETPAGAFLVPGPGAHDRQRRLPSRCAPSACTDGWATTDPTGLRRAATAVEFFGSLRRYVFERPDGEHAEISTSSAPSRARQSPSRRPSAGIPRTPCCTRPAGDGRRMSTIRLRSAAAYWLAVTGGAWMLGVVVVPTCWSGCRSGAGAASRRKPAHLRQLCPVLRQQDLSGAGRRDGEARRDADGRHRRARLLHRLLPDDEGDAVRRGGWRCSWPSSCRSGPAP